MREHGINEEELVNGCKQGSEALFRKLYEIYSPKMLGLCYRYVQDIPVAEDILQEGFIKIFHSIGKFTYKGPGSLKAWISKIFVNTALEYIRKNPAPGEIIPLEEYGQLEIMNEEEKIERIPTDVLMNLIGELPEGYRTIFNLYTFEEMSHKEIGKMLRINEASSRSQLSRAKSFLATRIKEYIHLNE